MSTAVPQSDTMKARGRRHPVRAVVRARVLHEAGWSSAEITRILHREGHTVTLASRGTVDRWVKPRAARKHTQRREAANRTRSNERRLRRISELRSAGLAPASVAAVMRLDYPDMPPMTAAHASGRAPALVVTAGQITDNVLLVLRAEGLSYTAIATISRLFYAVDIDEERVRRRLRKLGVGRSERRAEATRQAAQRRRQFTTEAAAA